MSFKVFVYACLALAVNGFFTGRNDRTDTCPDPSIDNGVHDKREAAWFHWTLPIGTTVRFTCEEGYNLIGNPTAKCKYEGTWTDLPKCSEKIEVAGKKKICDLPPIGDHVTVYPAKPVYDLDEQVAFVCRPPDERPFFRVTLCGADGQFSPSPPKCIQPLCVPPVPPKKGILLSEQPSYAVGEAAKFECEEGYVLIGNDKPVCGQDGYFPSTEARCIHPQSCDGSCDADRPAEFCSCNIKCFYKSELTCCPDVIRCSATRWFNLFRHN